MSTAICVRLPDALASQMEALAKQLDRPKAYILKKALEEYIEEYADYLVATERLNDKNDKLVSSKQMRERLGL